jgi:peptidyl-prolyl cis-trans isomerase A (cyclophilin A)
MLRSVLLSLALPLLLAACSAQEATQAPAEPVKTATPVAQAQAAAPPPAAEPAAEALPEPPAQLLDPSAATEQAPDAFTVKLETTQGDVLIDVTRAWSPHGADRFYNLVKLGYYDDTAFFRVIGGFMAQVGIHGHPQVNEAWRPAQIQDDPVVESNLRGMVTFAKSSAPNSRTTQFFISFKDNSNLDGMGFAPFGKVRDMTAVDALYKGYGEGAPRGRGPNQGRAQMQGNSYFRADFPKLDYIVKASIVE